MNKLYCLSSHVTKVLLLLVVTGFSSVNLVTAQEIRGKVTGPDGAAISGTSVTAKGSSLSTVTNNEGTYRINVSSLNDTLIFSNVGMRTKEVAIAGKTILNVSLEKTATELDDVIVIAYGTAKKESFTGSVAVVGRDKLDKVQVTTVTQALQGAVPGVQVSNSNGQPGSEPPIRIRGISSINGDSGPLIVLDGAPYGGTINGIDANDVASISVLKDASATALYGSRAAAGVVVITTKKGKEGGKATVDFKAAYGNSQLAMPLHKRVNNSEYYELRWEALRNGQIDRNPTLSPAAAAQYATNNLLSRLGNYNAFDKFPLLEDGKFDPTAKPKWTDTWEDALFKPGPRQDYHLNVSGGSDGGSYYMSFGYLGDKGALTFADFKRYTGRLSVTKKINKWFEAGLNSAFVNGVQNSPDGVRQVRFTLDLPDIYPVWVWDDAAGQYATDANGNRLLDFGSGQYNGLTRATWANTSPLGEARDSENKHERDNFSTRGYINLTFLPGLVFRNSLAVDYNVNADYVYWTNLNSWSQAQGGTSTRRRTRDIIYTLTNLLTYEKTFGLHHINLLAGHEGYSLKRNLVEAARNNFPEGIGSLKEAGAASNITGGFSTAEDHRIESYLSRAEYDYLNRYFFSASLRRDGTSRFSPENRWGNFWSVGASWIVSREKFMTSPQWLDNLSIKASYGTQGNEQIANFYAYQGLYRSDKENNNPAYRISTLPNRALKWETDIQTNLGIDVGILDHRVNISAEYFIKKSKDLLFNKELALSAGLGSIPENIGAIENKGFEVQLNTVNIRGRDLRWETELNISHFKNRITSLPAKELDAGFARYKIGTSVYDFYLPEWQGVNPENGNALWSKDIYQLDGSNNPVLDENGDKVVTGKERTENINEATYYYLGSSLPDIYGNFSNTFRYRGFDLSFNLYFVLGGKIYDNAYARLSHSGSRNVAETFSQETYEKRWQKPGDQTDVPRMTDFGSIGNTFTTPSSRYIVPGSYARLRNLTVGYALPERLISPIGLSQVRVYFQGDNMLTFFKYKSRGLDPEVGFNGIAREDMVPALKIFSGGIQVSF